MRIFDRMDFFLTKALLAIVAVAVPVFSIGLPLAGWVRNRPLEWQLDGPDGLEATAVPDRLVAQDGVSLRGAESVVVRIEEAGAGPWVSVLLPGVLLSLAVGLAAWLLLRLLQRIEQREPFAAASATACRLLGATILLGSLAVSLALGLADAVIAQRALDGAALGFAFEVPFVAFVAALLMLALAEAFAQGARLQHDVEGLV